MNDDCATQISESIQTFYQMVADSFRQSSITYNFHLIQHLPKFVNLYKEGTMDFATYLYESANHVISLYMQGYSSGLKEIANRIVMRYSSSFFIEKTLSSRIGDKKCNGRKMFLIWNNPYLVHENQNFEDTVTGQLIG